MSETSGLPDTLDREKSVGDIHQVLSKLYTNVRMLRILFQSSLGGDHTKSAQQELKVWRPYDSDF